jgi:hypothetical protein
MKHAIWSAIAIIMTLACASAQVRVDEDGFGKSLGGWTKRGKQAAEYPLSGSTYRTYKPEITPNPDGGIFISVRIDHVRGWLASDDHAVLEITVNKKGMIAAAQSNVAIQGRSISSDVIRSTGGAGKVVGAEHAVQVGADLVADLSAKLLREKIVEAGRVSFPAVLRHNYNLLFQAIRVDEPTPAKPEQTTVPPVVEKPETDGPKLEIKPYDTPHPEKMEPAK